MKNKYNKYNKYHNYQLNALSTTPKKGHDGLMLRYHSDNIMDSLCEEVINNDYCKPTYISQFYVLPKDDKSGEQMFNFKIYDKDGFQMSSRNVKESYLLDLSLPNQLVDATLIRNEEMKEALKDYGDFGWLEDTQGKERDDYSFALDINNEPYDTLGYIDIYPQADGSFTLEKYGSSFYVSELHEIEKLLSIFYGSVFSLKFKRIFVKWVRYEITIPRIEVADLSELKETVRTLRILLKKVDEQVNLD
ncbi:hypothetical protein [Lactococcus lactis]|uniref:Uncharacterized protein n=1 Tax=Lactococcus lactis subsp. lactis TaxID=1360 RepID=A0A0V8E5V8_LACLL|nr:hypothetical protein [Lactococcus lactis]KSU21016.1 hypothetical protein M20_1222 [Lactococcus lactis subsp. lactis]